MPLACLVLLPLHLVLLARLVRRGRLLPPPTAVPRCLSQVCRTRQDPYSALSAVLQAAILSSLALLPLRVHLRRLIRVPFLVLVRLLICI